MLVSGCGMWFYVRLKRMPEDSTPHLAPRCNKLTTPLYSQMKSFHNVPPPRFIGGAMFYTTFPPPIIYSINRESRRKRKICMSSSTKIIENFLPREHFDTLRDMIAGETFPWYFNKTKSAGKEMNENEDSSPGQFFHIVYAAPAPTSQFFEPYFWPIMEQLGFSLIARIKANLNHRLPYAFTSDFHVDIAPEQKNTMHQMTTSILYVNTNNGYTEFEESGRRVESVANRLVTFPANTVHRGITQTDTQVRILINFNYF